MARLPLFRRTVSACALAGAAVIAVGPLSTSAGLAPPATVNVHCPTGAACTGAAVTTLTGSSMTVEYVCSVDAVLVVPVTRVDSTSVICQISGVRGDFSKVFSAVGGTTATVQGSFPNDVAEPVLVCVTGDYTANGVTPPNATFCSESYAGVAPPLP